MEEKLIQFITESKTFSGFVFAGNYTMPNNVFIKLFYISINDNVNLLDDYSMFIYAKWDDKYNNLIDKETFKIKYSAICKLHDYNIINIDEFADIYDKITYQYNRYLSVLNNTPNKKRIAACRHTSNKEIRDQVFKIHGEICLCCGSTESISIDHVIPVSCGGKNDISNYQPLCKSCNSSKGSKIIDYRLNN